MQSCKTIAAKTVSSNFVRACNKSGLTFVLFYGLIFSCWRPTASGCDAAVTVYLAAADAEVQPQQTRVGTFGCSLDEDVLSSGPGPRTCPSPSTTLLIRSTATAVIYWLTPCSAEPEMENINILRVLAKLHFIIFLQIMSSSTKYKWVVDDFKNTNFCLHF